MFNNVIEQFHYYKVHFHFKFTVVACFSSIALEYQSGYENSSFFAQIIKRIKSPKRDNSDGRSSWDKSLPCHALLLRWLLFSLFLLTLSDFEKHAQM
jgi:hypothetical protein